MIADLPLRLAASCLTLAAALHPATGRCQTPPIVAVPAALAPAGVQMEHISVVTIGKGSPVILIPGLSSPRETWAGVTPELARHHRVHLVQVNGFGGDDPRANLSPGVLDGVVADLHAFISRERIAGAAVVGHSLGGLLALKLAAAHPGDAGRVMIVDALPFYGMLFGPGMTPAVIEPRAAMMRDAMKAGYGKPADPARSQALVNAMALKPSSRALVLGWTGKADARVGAQAMYEDLTTDVTADLPRIAVPLTLVVPYNDTLPQAQVDALYRGAYKGLPHLTVVEVPDAAHFVMLDQPEAFARALAAFLAG